MAMFVFRAVLLTAIGAAIGILIGAYLALAQGEPLFLETGKKFAVDWYAALIIGVVAVALAALASSMPAMVWAMRHPADLIGRDS